MLVHGKQKWGKKYGSFKVYKELIEMRNKEKQRVGVMNATIPEKLSDLMAPQSL